MSISFQRKQLILLLLFLVIVSNFAIYNTSLSFYILPKETSGVVLGSIVDLMIVCPILILVYRNIFSWKLAIVLSAAGCIAIRFIIPTALLQPYHYVFSFGIFIELLLVCFELFFIVSFLRYMPQVITNVKHSPLPHIFAYSEAVHKHAKQQPIMQLFCAEMLMFYYAFASWRKKAPNGITLYKQSSIIAFEIMMIHAIVIETIGVHYWLHSKAPILSLLLLLLNIYSVIFFLADIQALRLNTVHFSDNAMYISLGLMKRAKIELANIEEVIEDSTVLQRKKTKDTIDFVARDFEQVYPQLLLKMKEPLKAQLFMGREKYYSYVAIKCDQIDLLKHTIEKGTRS